MEQDDKLKKLYDNISKEYDLPAYEQFRNDMQDETKRKKLYDAVSKDYDLPDYNTFSSDMGVKKKAQTGVPFLPPGESATPSTENTKPVEKPAVVEAKKLAISTPSVMVGPPDPSNPYSVTVNNSPSRPSAPILPSDIDRMNVNKDADKVKVAMRIDEKATPFRDKKKSQELFNQFKIQGFSDEAIEKGMADADKAYIDKSQADEIPLISKTEHAETKQRLIGQGAKEGKGEGADLDGAVEEAMQNKRDQFAVNRLSPDDRAIYGLNSEIDAIVQNPKQSPEDRIKLASLQQQAKDLKAQGSKMLYDPKTGQMVGAQNAPKEAVEYAQKVNQLAEQYTYKDKLLDLRNEAYSKIQYWDKLQEANNKMLSESVKGLLAHGGDPNMSDDANAVKESAENIKAKRDEALLNYDALNKAIMINQNPGTIREGGLQQFKDRFTHAISKEIPFFQGDDSGDLTTKDYYQGLQTILNSAKDDKMVPKEMKADYQDSFAGELGQATGGIVGIMPKLIAAEIATEGAASFTMLPKAIAALKRSASVLDKTTAFLMESGIEAAKFDLAGLDTKAAPGFVLPGYLGKYRFSVNPTGKVGAIIAPFIASTLEKAMYGTAAMEAGGATESVGAALLTNRDVSTELEKRFGSGITDFTKKVILDFAANTLVAIPGSLKSVASSPFSTPEALRKAANDLDDNSKDIYQEYVIKRNDNDGEMPKAEAKEYATRIYDNSRSADEMRKRADALEKSVFSKKVDNSYEDVTGKENTPPAADEAPAEPKPKMPPPPFNQGDKVPAHVKPAVAKTEPVKTAFGTYDDMKGKSIQEVVNSIDDVVGKHDEAILPLQDDIAALKKKPKTKENTSLIAEKQAVVDKMQIDYEDQQFEHSQEIMRGIKAEADAKGIDLSEDDVQNIHDDLVTSLFDEHGRDGVWNENFDDVVSGLLKPYEKEADIAEPVKHTEEEANKKLSEINASGKKPTGEELFAFLESLPTGAVAQHEGSDTRTVIGKKSVGKSGGESYELIPQILNEDTGEWEDNPSALTIVSKDKHGEYNNNADLPTDFKPLGYTDIKSGDRQVSYPKITYPNAVQPAADKNADTTSNNQSDGKDETNITGWHEAFEKAKKENDTDAIENLHSKIRIALNGVVQGRIKDPAKLASTIKEFEDLKNEIEQYAEDWKKAKAESAKQPPAKPEKSIDQQIRDQKKRIDDAEKDNTDGGAPVAMNPIPTRKQARLLYEYGKLAWLYLKKGVGSLADFLRVVGERFSEYAVKAWNEAKENFDKERIAKGLDNMKIKNKLFGIMPPFNLFPAIWNTTMDVTKKAILSGSRSKVEIEKAIDDALVYAKNELAAAGGPAMLPAEEKMFKARMRATMLRIGKTPSFALPNHPISDAEKKVAQEMFNQMLNPKDKPSTLPGKVKDFFLNLSKHIDNPFVYVTRLEDNVLKAYPNAQRMSRVPLGRVFEQSYTGPAKLAVEAFIDDVLKGLSNTELQSLHEYIAARRVIDRLKDEDNIKATGNVTIQQALAQLENIQDRLSPSQYQKIVDRGELFQKHADGIMLELYEGGLISQETLDLVMNSKDFYAPFSVVQNIFTNLTKKADGKPQSTVLHKIKGISSKPADFTLNDLNKLQDGVDHKIITQDEFYRGAQELLDGMYSSGTITEEQYTNESIKLADPGFAVNNIFDRMAEMIYKSRILGERNKTMQRVHKLREVDEDNHFFKEVDGFELRHDANGQPFMFPKNIDQIKSPEGFAPIQYKIDGKTKFVAVNEEAAKALRGINDFEMNGVMKLINLANKVARVGIITYSTSFLFANSVIDNFRSLTMSKYGAIAGKDIADKTINAAILLPQMIEALGSSLLANFTGIRTKQYEDWMKSKSFTRGAFDDIFNDPNHKITDKINMTTPQQAVSMLKYILTVVPRLGVSLEQMPKIYTYTRGMDVEGVDRVGFTKWAKETLLRLNALQGKSGDELVAALDEIAFDTLNRSASPNFSAAGNWAKYMSGLFQFFSARVKGEFSDWRTITNTEGGTLGIRKNAVASGLAMGMLKIGMYALLPMLYAAIKNMWNDDDEKSFDTVTNSDKNNNILFKTGSQFSYDGETYDDYVKLPLRGIPATANTMVVNYLDYLKKNNPESFKNMAVQAMSNATPINLNLNYKEGDDLAQKSMKLGNAIAANTNPALKFTYEELRGVSSYNGYPLTNEKMAKAYYSGNTSIMPWEIKLKYGTKGAEDISKEIYNTTGVKVTAAFIDHLHSVMLGGVLNQLDSNALSKRIYRSEESYPIKK